jgi:hypothetical protein
LTEEHESEDLADMLVNFESTALGIDFHCWGSFWKFNYSLKKVLKNQKIREMWTITFIMKSPKLAGANETPVDKFFSSPIKFLSKKRKSGFGKSFR